jgi:hypothetical protein
MAALCGTQKLSLQQLPQLLRGNRLVQGPEHVERMRPGQPLGGLQNTLILAANQHQRAGVAAIHQVTHEFHAIHPGHLQIAQDQSYRFTRRLQRDQGVAGRLTSADFR